MADPLADRCEDLRGVMLELTPLMIESLGNAQRLAAVRQLLPRVRAVVAQGSEGIDNPAYTAWLAGATANLDAIESEIDRGDASAAWELFRDPQHGLATVGVACAGHPGW